MKLLDEAAALDAMRTLLARTDHARFAVAFWGKGAVGRLGIDRPGLSLEILCNLVPIASARAGNRFCRARQCLRREAHMPRIHKRVPTAHLAECLPVELMDAEDQLPLRIDPDDQKIYKQLYVAVVEIRIRRPCPTPLE